MARTELRKRAAGREAEDVSHGEAAAKAADLAAEAPANALDDPETQHKILNPESIRFELEVEGETIVLELPTELSIANVVHRRIYERLEQYSTMLVDEMKMLRPGVDTTTLTQSPGLFEAAMKSPDLRSLLRIIIAEITGIKPFILQLGMSTIDETTAGLFLLNRMNDERKRRSQKKAATTTS